MFYVCTLHILFEGAAYFTGRGRLVIVFGMQCLAFVQNTTSKPLSLDTILYQQLR